MPSAMISTRHFRRFYSPEELRLLTRINAYGPGKDFSETQVSLWRQMACAYIERIGVRLGFPRRTIASAQTLYHRFHLHYPYRDFDYKDVAITCVLVASKIENTIKKTVDIQAAAWQVDDLLKGGDGVGSTRTDAKRTQIMAIERLVLRTLSYHLDVLKPTFVDLSADKHSEGHDVFSWLMRIARSLGAGKAQVRVAHLLAIDVFRTLAPLSHPPHSLAVGCLYLAGYLIDAESVGVREGAELDSAVKSASDTNETSQPSTNILPSKTTTQPDQAFTHAAKHPRPLDASPSGSPRERPNEPKYRRVSHDPHGGKNEQNGKNVQTGGSSLANGSTHASTAERRASATLTSKSGLSVRITLGGGAQSQSESGGAQSQPSVGSVRISGGSIGGDAVGGAGSNPANGSSNSSPTPHDAQSPTPPDSVPSTSAGDLASEQTSDTAIRGPKTAANPPSSPPPTLNVQDHRPVLVLDHSLLWASTFQTTPEDIIAISLSLLDLLGSLLAHTASAQPSPAYSPFSQTSPASHSSHQSHAQSIVGTAQILSAANWRSISRTCGIRATPPIRHADDIVRIKSALRQNTAAVTAGSAHYGSSGDSAPESDGELAASKRRAARWNHGPEGVERAYRRCLQLYKDGVDIDPVNYQDTVEGSVRYAF